MEKKIEKMGHFLVPCSTSEGVVDALRSLADKLNEIIDHLNSQAQPEIFKELSDKNIRDDIPEGFVEINGKLHKMEDTPEEWSWKFLKGGCEPTDYSKQPKMEEELHDKLLEIWCGLLPTPSKASFDPEPIRIRIEGTEKYVKQLLDDREREAYHDGYTDGVTRCMDSLNKLEEDKNEGA
jgi:hypothetical protein